MTTLKEFTLSSARPLPVIVLADVSGSMAEAGKIQALNAALREMIASFAEEEDVRAQIQLAVITFGGEEAHVHLPLTSAAKVTWQDMAADGRTPMGAAFDKARELVEDRNQIPSRAYRPTLVLLSDGEPNDDGRWEPALEKLLASERVAKAERMALAIGVDPESPVLKRFVANGQARVFRADEARQIQKFFRLVTMSVSSRSRSANPNGPPAPPATDLDSLV